MFCMRWALPPAKLARNQYGWHHVDEYARLFQVARLYLILLQLIQQGYLHLPFKKRSKSSAGTVALYKSLHIFTMLIFHKN